MSSALATINNFEDLQKTGEMMARSGLFKDSTDVFKAMVQIQAGQELGVSPFQSMSGIHIIKGKPVLSAGLLAALIKNHPDYDYRVKSHTAHECIVEFYEKNEVVGESSFSMDDAKRAGLLSNPTWNKYPKNMVFSRALSNGAKWYCAGIFGGSVYVEGEIVEADPVRVVSQSKHRASNHGGYSSGANGDTEKIEGEIVEDDSGFDNLRSATDDLSAGLEPVPADYTLEWEAFKASLSDGQKKAAANKFAESIPFIRRYATNFHQANNALKLLFDFELKDNSFSGMNPTAAKVRVGIFDALSLYAHCRDCSMTQDDALMVVYSRDFGGASTLLFSNEVGNAPTGDQQPLFPEEVGGI